MRTNQGITRGLIPGTTGSLPAKLIPGSTSQEDSENRKFEYVPKDWFLSTLAVGAAIMEFQYAFRRAYASTGTNAIGDPYTIQLGTSLILFQYSFWAEEPDVGPGRTKPVPPHELINQVAFFWLVDGKEPVQASYNVSGTQRRGQPFLYDPGFTRREIIPIVIHGQSTLQPFQSVITNPGWTITNVGFYMSGFSVDTTTIKDALRKSSSMK